jgi:hypothetical protein
MFSVTLAVLPPVFWKLIWRHKNHRRHDRRRYQQA